MEYQCIENEKTGELKILVNGESLQLSRCACTIAEITYGIEFGEHLRAKLWGDRISEISIPDILYLGESKKEQLKYSRNGLEYSFLPDGHSKDVVDSVKNHYAVIKNQLEKLMERYHGKPTNYYSRFHRLK